MRIRTRVPIVVAVCALVALAGVLPSAASGQKVFHSTQSANLSTTETLRGGNWMFEISHRFTPAISEGSGAFWGLDGPANNRLGLAYAPVNRVLVGVIRSNLDDNLELNAKALAWDGQLAGAQVSLGGMAGGAWNMDVVEVDGAEDNEFQFYAQFLANVLLGESLALGVVPSWLHNPRLRDFEKNDAVALGLHGQWYLTGSMSLLGEWIFSEEIPDTPYDSGTFGIEFETRGHFFKIIVTNQVRMQATQFLAGSANSFALDELRLGFNITRLLPF
jgi:uncharacterized beta barrel domain-containing protein DUF5777